MKPAVLCLVAVVSPTVAAIDRATTVAVAGTPIEKVVTLLQELKSEVLQTGRSEESMYDKYKCWCEKTTERKAKAIEDAKAKLKELGNEIVEGRAKIAKLTAEIKQLVEDIKEKEEEQQELTELRKKEHALFMAETTEMRQAVEALKHAILVLEGVQGDAPPQAKSLIQRWSAVSDGVSQALRAQPAAAELSPRKLSLVGSFLRDMQQARASGAEKYTPKSSMILGILKEMHDNFSEELKKIAEEEKTHAKDFEDLMAVKQTELKSMQDGLKQRHKDKADAEVAIADAQELFDETDEQLKADVEFFDKTKSACMAKAHEWKMRSEYRKEELAGIEKALEILTSDEAREIFQKSMGDDDKSAKKAASFLQTFSAQDSAPTMKAFKALQVVATRSHSVRLAKLAARVRVASAGRFDKVIAAIDEVIQTLKKEEKDDIAKRDQCKDEYTKIDSTVADLDWKIEKNKAEIGKLEKLIEQREDEKTQTMENIVTATEDITKMEDTRKEENAAYLEEKSDDEKAIELVNKAIDALKSYYEKNKLSFAQEDPTFEVDEDVPPDATFSHRGKNVRETKGIVGIMEIIVEDLKADIKSAIKAEEEAQADYEAQMKVAKKLKAELEDKKVSLEKAIAARKEDKADEEKSLKSNEGDLKAEKKYQKEIKPDCDWVLDKWEKRTAARKAEMDALVSAKEYLSGAAPPALIQKRPIDDDAFSRIDFSGISFLQRRQ